MLVSTLILLALSSGSYAADCQGPVQVSAEQLLAISTAGSAASTLAVKPIVISETCSPLPHDAGPNDCATAKQAAAGLTVAFKAFQFKSMGKAAAAIGNMMAESGSFSWASKSIKEQVSNL